MGRIPQHIVDEIITTARIEEVIGEFVQLKKSGSNFKGLSPFTEEKTPSFMVSPAKQIFKCFSTGTGGTVVTFLMEHEQISYPEALRWLADKYNVIIPEDESLTPEEKEAISEKESLQIVNTFARDFFVTSLKTTIEGKSIGLSYFKERGFREEIIEKFQLGYSPLKEKSLTETALAKGYKLTYLKTLGLTKSKDDRNFDFFSGRVIFPIHSVSGKVIGFGGRVLKTSKQTAKYFNSPESPLYDKGKVLYGLYFAKNEILKQDNCYLVEGYTDVISLSQSGIKNVVSSSGTSLTTGQIRLVSRFTQNITILYDSDAAGIKASFRGIDMLLEEGINVKVLSFPEGDDPDSYAKRVGADELKLYLDNNKKDFISFKTGMLLQDAKDDPIQRAKLIKEIVSSIALIPDEITRSVYLKETADQFKVKEIALLNELNKSRRKHYQETQKQTWNKQEVNVIEPIQNRQIEKTSARRTFYEQEFDLIRILIMYGSRAIETKNKEKDALIEVSVAELIISEIEKDQLHFEHPLFQKLYKQCKQGLDEDIFYEPSLFLRSEDQDIVRFVTDILSPRFELSSNWLRKFNVEVVGEIHQLELAVKEALYSFKNAFVLAKIQNIQEQLKEQSDSEIVTELLKEQIEWEKVRQIFAIQLGRIVG